MTQLPDLRLPPTSNTYYRRVGSYTLISAEGRAYRQYVVDLIAPLGLTPLEGPLSLVARFYRPDARRRDLDNLKKSLWDSLRHAGVYHDDSQIEHEDARLLAKGLDGCAGVVKIWVGALLPDPGVAYFAGVQNLPACAPQAPPSEGARQCKRQRKPRSPGSPTC